MLNIRNEQLEALTKQTRIGLANELVAQLRTKLPAAVSIDEQKLKNSILAWIEDAQLLGLRCDKNIRQFVMSRAVCQGYREDLHTRLLTYLRLHHSDRLHAVNPNDFVDEALRLASKCDVKQEEGITWLAVIMLHNPADGDLKWIEEALRQEKSGNEEQRILAVHQEAARRGWIRNLEVLG
jgi:hypothetical protein